ncbi:MAG: 3-deoxy-manno-octulosonate cytidylyltransferase [Gemmatimonadetes bacterium]|nr:3-deoxy-manno-octulosonate cytidylyltransferase [Gemmatimonadota bacterium]
MHVLCVIPARLGSTRLPNKPLRLLAGEPLIRRVVQRVQELGLDARVVVATDSRRVAGAVQGLGVESVLTNHGHDSGTERVAEVIQRPEYADFDLIVNVQGDEPFIPSEAVHGALARVVSGDAIGTAAAPLAPEHAMDPNCVKVLVDGDGHVLSFSRSLIPSSLHHIGVYVYRRDALLAWVGAEPVAEETKQGLEQLRPLALGMNIGVAVLDEAAPPGIDTDEDLKTAQAYLTGVGV